MRWKRGNWGKGYGKMLIVKNLIKKYGNNTVIDDISFNINKGEIFGLIGESGCGKTTTARIILRLLNFGSGEIFFDGEDIMNYDQEKMHIFRRKIQIVFQDPLSSLNPKITIEDALKEPLIIHNICPKSKCGNRIEKLLLDVGLSKDYLKRYPHELSGGECQRICIARALALEPIFIVLDEPVSSLDYSMQDKIINLLSKLKSEHSFTYLFITHDILLARSFCSRVAVMRNGKIIEAGSRDDIFLNPREEYTKQLLDDAL